MAISIALMSMVMGAFVVALEGGSDAFFSGSARGVVSARVDEALRAMAADLRETQAGHVITCQNGLPDGQCALALSSARDADGDFHVTGSYRPDWQAVVAYCPYVTSKGLRQFRRYVVYDGSGTYTFPFSFRQITDEEIQLEDALGQELTINRAEGNPSLEEGREYQVYCPGFTGLAVVVGDTTRLTLGASALTRRNKALSGEGDEYVALRN